MQTIAAFDVSKTKEFCKLFRLVNDLPRGAMGYE